MTNLNFPNKKKELITPEKSLIFTPIIIGLFILASLLGFVYLPLTKRLSNEESQIQLLNEKISYMILYKNYINELSTKITNAKRQQESLINIISDPQELETILSEINRICIENNIEIIDLKPKTIVKNIQSQYKSSPDLKTNNILNSDPFLIPSIEKHIFNITLTGEFNSLLNFLKELELMQAIAISDNIQIKADSVNKYKSNLKLIMTFDLSSYAKLSNKTKK
mgnify:CR=1 FL=1|tara:strand:+ start:973 stop:1644 length:672 start_codon:yes stop_codon:yes gene_type:complete